MTKDINQTVPRSIQILGVEFYIVGIIDNVIDDTWFVRLDSQDHSHEWHIQLPKLKGQLPTNKQIEDQVLTWIEVGSRPGMTEDIDALESKAYELKMQAKKMRGLQRFSRGFKKVVQQARKKQ